MTPTNVEKRKEREEMEDISPSEWKRQKVTEVATARKTEYGVDDLAPSQQQPEQFKPFVGANELASAFALASLATMSPTQNNLVKPSAAAEYESRDADNDPVGELDAPAAVPISPDVRSPVRSAPFAPVRRVTFSEDTKSTSRIKSRRLSLPPRAMAPSKKQHSPKSRMVPPGYPFGQNHYFPHYTSRPPNTPPLPPPPQWGMGPGMRHHGPPSLFMPPLHPRPDAASEQHKWICDFCNVASFETYEEACIHEDHCRARPNRSWSHPPGPVPNAATLRAVHRMRRNLSMAPPPSSYGATDAITPPPNRGLDGSPKIHTAESVHPTISNMGSVDMSEVESSPIHADPVQHSLGQLRDGDPIVLLDDMTLVPPYVYFLMRQVEITHFTEADRFVARSKGPVGYSGFQCRHCHGHAGLGKYFPVTAKSLSTNSTSQNIHSHLLKCRKVAPYIKEQLMALKEEKSKAPRLEPGWRRIFFEKIWGRLHG